MKGSWGRTEWTLLGCLLAVPLMCIFVVEPRTKSRSVFVGSTAPPFSLPVARGGSCSLGDLLAKKRVVLLSFLDARLQPLSRTYSDGSRGQVVFLKSMAQQYAPKGVEVLIVGCNQPFSAKPIEIDSLLNFTYDWQLDGLSVLRGDENTASRYGVFTLPTTLLIAPDGQIQRRWDGFVAAAQLALALEPLVGSPQFRQ